MKVVLYIVGGFVVLFVGATFVVAALDLLGGSSETLGG